jgi:NAD(P)-dependent dehydrogenase (short-subunit alcohol dehydrogenase family)
MLPSSMQENIRANVVGPGFIRTPLLDHMSEQTLKNIAALHPMNRLGTVTEVADLVLWLASDRASFVTGAYFAVDGGYLAQ